MTKLEKYLIKSSIAILQSDNTNSVYYTIDNLKVRLSDHLAKEENDCDLSIISPTESKVTSIYIVQLPSSRKLAIWNTKQILDYVSFLKLHKNLLTPNMKEKRCSVDGVDLVPLIKSKFSVNLLKKDLRKIVGHGYKTWRASEQFWLREMLSKEFGFEIIFTTAFEEFLATSEITYKGVLNVYNTIFVTKEKFEDRKYIELVYKYVKELM